MNKYLGLPNIKLEIHPLLIDKLYATIHPRDIKIHPLRNNAAFNKISIHWQPHKRFASYDLNSLRASTYTRLPISLNFSLISSMPAFAAISGVSFSFAA